TYQPPEGSYKPLVDFSGKAITVRSDRGPANCNIQGGEHVVVFRSGEGRDSVLQGFTVSNSGQSDGILIEEASPIISGNIVTGIWGEWGDSAVCVHGGSPLIIGNLITDNAGFESRSAGVGSWYGAQPVIAFTTIAGNRYRA